ncbi:GNAT family N-acetyltransferase [Symbioplanes lichenis]|uniref:GNAT family N-acetyltransferase n=1 Tax=Symbioplanes lichenis TaxID=1629072 RepID=UPI00273896F2|nr:GNAT family N-acetyltransferase [Actinoplanes lichenis]
MEPGVDVRVVSQPEELAALDALLGGIWSPGRPMVGGEMLRALAKAGNYVAAAYAGDELVGGCFGFFGPPDVRELHSHVAGVVPGAAGRGVGYALKQHQRRWARSRGATAITWTFDPLVARNAYFNLAKLGAVPVEYLPDFYGPMHDTLNGADPSDRLLVRWEVAGGEPLECDPAGGTVVLDENGRRGPVHGEKLLVAVPPDIERLRVADPAAAARWRSALREVLTGLLASGARFTGFDRAGWYVLTTDRGPGGRL